MIIGGLLVVGGFLFVDYLKEIVLVSFEDGDIDDFERTILL